MAGKGSKVHWIGMNGSSGCTPDSCDVYDRKEDAVRSLVSTFDGERGLFTGLMRDHYFEFPSPGQAGADYAEISRCTCDTPWVHSESMTEADWTANHGGEL